MELETRALKITVRPDKIIEIATKESWTEADTVEIALENIERIKEAVAHGGRAMLSYTPGTYMDKKVLQCYKEADIDHVASALLVESFGSKIVGNLFLKVLGGVGLRNIPTKIFTKREEAEAWLLQQIAAEKS